MYQMEDELGDGLTVMMMMSDCESDGKEMINWIVVTLGLEFDGKGMIDWIDGTLGFEFDGKEMINGIDGTLGFDMRNVKSNG